ncbi:GNAT family N-acetyltransferase [Micromonospora sp. NPDC048871]|uniref:GNAT family N-acetyltransferase n=1 Tax=unclassified Micromonospora TaxID=2617518 RepID=UPI002E15DC9E|nr:GNAT family N-acetyltransferase [Micromonospora sp. NBC_01739]
MVLVDQEPWESTDAVRLREAQRVELDARYGNDNHEPGEEPTAASVPVFLVARDADGTAVGCGGLRLLTPDSAEIKRMYVVPAARGTGVAVAILRALEQRARELGVRTLLLETGTAQPEAMRFYEREGYHRIDNFGPYRGAPLSLCYARDLP